MGKRKLNFGVRLARGGRRASYNDEDNVNPSGERGHGVIDSFPLGSFEHILSFLQYSRQFSDLPSSFLEGRTSLKMTSTGAGFSSSLCTSAVTSFFLVKSA